MTAAHICRSLVNAADMDDIAFFLSTWPLQLDTPIALARQTCLRPSSVALVFEAPNQHVWPTATELSRLDTEKFLSRLLLRSGSASLVSQRRITRRVKSSPDGH